MILFICLFVWRIHSQSDGEGIFNRYDMIAISSSTSIGMCNWDIHFTHKHWTGFNLLLTIHSPIQTNAYRWEWIVITYTHQWIEFSYESFEWITNHRWTLSFTLEHFKSSIPLQLHVLVRICDFSVSNEFCSSFPIAMWNAGGN